MATTAPRDETESGSGLPGDGLRRETVWGTARIFAADAVLLPTGLVTTAYLTRHLGLEGYGVYSLAAAIVVWLEWSVGALFTRATLKLVAESVDWRPVGATLNWAHLVAGVVVGAVVAASASVVAAALALPALAHPLRLLALDVPVACVANSHRSLLLGVGSYGTRATAAAARHVARMTFAILLVALGLGVDGVVFAIIGSSLVELLIARRVVRPAWWRDPRISVRRIGAVALPLLLFAMTLRLLDKVDLLAVQRLERSAAAAGAYAAAQNLAVAPGLFASALSGILLATLGRLAREGRVGESRRLARGSLRAVLLLLPFAALGAGAAAPIVRLAFGAAFADAALLVPWLAFAAMAILFLGVASAILVADDHPWDPVVVTAPLVIASVAGFAVAIPRFGAVGAAAVTAVVAFAAAVGAAIAVHRRLAVAPPATTLVWSVLASVLAFATSRWISALVTPLVALAVILFLALAVPLFFLGTGELSRHELALLTARRS